MSPTQPQQIDMPDTLVEFHYSVRQFEYCPMWTLTRADFLFLAFQGDRADDTQFNLFQYLRFFNI